MPDAHLPRRAAANRRTGVRKNALCARFAAALSAALAVAPQLARADDGCGPPAATRALVARLGGGELAPLEAGLAADLSVADFAGADSVLGAPLANGELAVVYLRAGRACGLRVLSASELAALAALRRAGISLAGPSF